jgi:hypothetical protein
MEFAMKSGLRLVAASTTLAIVIALAGCGAAQTDEPAQGDDPPAPEAESSQPSEPDDVTEPANLLDEIQAADYTAWTPAPGNESPVPAQGPHGDEVQTLLDPTAEEGLASGGDQWPLDSVIAKDIFRDGELIQIAAMKKTADGWYWGEWDAEGDPIVEGIAVEPCEGCHADGTDGTLGVVLK